MDPYDITISTKTKQPTFWSVGYKSSTLRKKFSPLKNKAPHMVNFGRRPRWNCPKEDGAPTTTTVASTTTTSTTARSPLTRPPPRQRIKPTRHRVKPTSRQRVRKPTREWSDWLSPPNKPITQTGGFSPNLTSLNLSPRRRSQEEIEKRTVLQNTDWVVPPINCDEAKTQQKPLYIQLGPAAFHRGNRGLGSDGEGRAFYVNGILTPDIYLRRGVKYTFMVETGAGDKESDFHPVYITSDQSGGHQLKPDLQARAEAIFGGVNRDRDGTTVPTAIGRLCLWWNNRPAATFATYSDFQKSLSLDCQDYASDEVSAEGLMSAMRGRRIGDRQRPRLRRRPPGILQFTPTKDMPDTLYYQSYVARHVGGVIHLVDHCSPSLPPSSFPPTFRPSLSHHLDSTASATKQTPNRRIDYDVEDYEYIDDYEDDTDKALLEQCRTLAAQKERKLIKTSMKPLSSSLKKSVAELPVASRSNPDLPTFEHFPMRDISKRSTIDVSEETCKELIQKLASIANNPAKER